jgi:membrane protease YdiL (CAAX protease family)
MGLPLDVFNAPLAGAAAAAAPATASEAELLARFPVLAGAAALLFVLGLACDLYLLLRVRRRDVDWAAFAVGAKPWGPHELLGAGLAIGLLFIVGNGLVAGLLKLARLEETAAVPWLLLGELVLRLMMLAGLLAFLRRRHIDWRSAFGFKARPGIAAVSFGVICYLAALPPLAMVFVLSATLARLLGIEAGPQPVVELLATTDSPLVVGLIVVFALAVAPAFEEVFFRGFAYPALKQRWGSARAMLGVSAVFALVHFHAPSAGPLFALGIGLTLAYERTGSLLAPITMHALFNCTTVAALLYVRAQG